MFQVLDFSPQHIPEPLKPPSPGGFPPRSTVPNRMAPATPQKAKTAYQAELSLQPLKNCLVNLPAPLAAMLEKNNMVSFGISQLHSPCLRNADCSRHCRRDSIYPQVFLRRKQEGPTVNEISIRRLDRHAEHAEDESSIGFWTNSNKRA